MKKPFKIVVGIISSLVIALALPLLACAQEADVSIVNIDFIPTGGNVVESYLNKSNGGFVARTFLEEYESIERVELLLDGSSFSTPIMGTSTGGGYVIFDSGTVDSSVLQGLISEGGHYLSLMIYPNDGSPSREVARKEINADYTPPEGTLSYTITISPSTAPGWLKVGDKVNFQLAIGGADTTAGVGLPTGTFNGRKITWAIASTDKLTGKYLVVEGDSDQNLPTSITGVMLSDLAGNEALVTPISVAESIDANSPQVTVLSPEAGKTYSSREVPLGHAASELLSKLSFMLDGVPVPAGATSLKDLAEGNHTLSAMAEDIAGNKRTSSVNFSVDTTPPPVSIRTNPDGGSIPQGNTVVFEGETEPNAKVKIEVYSDPLIGETTAGSDGRFRIEINTGGLGAGTHDAYITAVDAAGNITRFKISTFEIYIPEPVVLAQAPMSSETQSSDVKPPIVSSSSSNRQNESASEEEVAISESNQMADSGSAISSSTSRGQKTNWGAWLTLFGIAILAAAIATAGYYGYEWATAEDEGAGSVAKDTERSPPTKQIESELSEEIQTIVDAKAVEDSLSESNGGNEPSFKELEAFDTLEQTDDTPKTRW